MLNEASVEIDAGAQLVGFDPFVGGVGLRNVAWAEDDHLFHLLDKSHAVGAVSHCGGFAAAR